MEIFIWKKKKWHDLPLSILKYIFLIIYTHANSEHLLECLLNSELDFTVNPLCCIQVYSQTLCSYYENKILICLCQWFWRTVSLLSEFDDEQMPQKSPPLTSMNCISGLLILHTSKTINFIIFLTLYVVQEFFLGHRSMLRLYTIIYPNKISYLWTDVPL